MSENKQTELHERLSALADGELKASELDELLSSLGDLDQGERNVAMNKWVGYQSVESTPLSDSNQFSAKVMAAIEREPLLRVVESDGGSSVSSVTERVETESTESKTASNKPQFYQWAVAASVCLAVVFGWQSLQPPTGGIDPTGGNGVLISDNSGVVPVQPVSTSPSFTAPSTETVVANRLNGLQNGIQTVSVGGGPSTAGISPESLPVVDLSTLDDMSKEDAQNFLHQYHVRHSANSRLTLPNGSLPLIKTIGTSDNR